jgi:hypothetical protein
LVVWVIGSNRYGQVLLTARLSGRIVWLIILIMLLLFYEPM